MISGIISSATATVKVTGGGSVTDVYSDTTDDNFGIGEGLTFHADAEDNIAIGENALNSTSGAALSNVGIGTNALTAISSSDYNVAIGSDSQAASTNADAHGNISIGFETMSAGTSHFAYNVGIGHQSMMDVTQGDENVCVGRLSGENITNGSENVFLGSGAGSLSLLVGKAVCIGYRAGFGVMTADADGSVCIGYKAGHAVTDAQNCTFIGENAGLEHADGDSNTAIGTSAFSNTNGIAGIENTFIGVNSGSGSAWVTAASSYNVAIGNYTMNGAMNAAAGNTVIGYSAGYGITEADSSVAIGYQAMLTHTTGSSNIAIGSGAMKDTNAGSNSLGSEHNMFIGKTSGGGIWADAPSQYNVAVGNFTMSGALNGASNNTSLGYNALPALTEGDTNVAIGSSAGAAVTTGSNNTMLGYQADVDAATDSYHVRLGHYGALRYMTAQVTLSDFTAVTADDAATDPLLKIPQYGFLNRVTCTVVTASGGTGEYQISLGTAVEAPGDSVAGQVEIIGAGASDLTGCVSRTQATDAAGDTNVDIITAKQLHIFEADLTDADNNGAWMANDMYLYVCHANGSNATNAQNAVVRITAEYFGED